MDESELVIGGYLYPNIKGDATVAWEQEYKDNNEVETEVALEEGYISFLDLPFNAQAELGRKFIGFGKLNPVHAHTWSFVDKPLVLENFLGEESWNDDGVNLNFLIPNPWDWYIKSGIGFYNGKDVEGDNLIDWNGRLLVHRTSLNVPFSDNFDTSIGYSRAWDEKNSTTLQGADVSLTYRFDDSYRKLRWQNEVLTARIDSIGIPDQDGEQERYPFGAYSLLSFALDKNWSLGARYDWSETPVDDQNHSWASSAFVTYHFTESLLARVQYRHLEQISEPDPDNTIFLQVIWGIGPHSHRLQD